jgi:ribosomal protein S18
MWIKIGNEKGIESQGSSRKIKYKRYFLLMKYVSKRGRERET